MFKRSLKRAFCSLFKPVLLLSPFRHLPEHLYSVVLPLVLIGSYTSFQQTGDREPWAHWFYCLLSFLSLTRQQFNFLVNIPQVIQPPEPITIVDYLITRPKVFLRVLIPRTGFSVVIRAAIDNGCTGTFISSELASLLLANGAQVRYTWPFTIVTREDRQNVNRTLDGSDLLLQSVEDEKISFQPTPILIDEWTAFLYGETDMFKVANILKDRGVLPAVMEKRMSVITDKEDTILKRDSLFDYRFDMLIGQDLQNRFVFVHPRQPTYHITPSLAMIRTKLGIVFSGWLDYNKLDNWKVTPEEAKRIECILYPEKAEENNVELPKPSSEEEELSTLSPQTQVQINKLLTENLSNNPMTWVDFYHFLLSLLFFPHLVILLLLSLLIAFFLQSILTISFSRHIPLLQKHIICAHTAYLSFLFIIADNIRQLYSSFLFNFLGFLGCTIPPQLMNFSFGACLPLTVSIGSGNGKQQHSILVNAFIDAGSMYSSISLQLVKKLGLKPERFEDNDFVKVTLSNPNLTGNQMNINTGYEFELWQDNLNRFKISHIYSFLPSNLVSKLAHLLSIPLHPPSTSPQAACYDLVLGTNLLTYFLPQTRSPRVISLLPNLSAHETSFGYYLQGQQKNAYLPWFIKNWSGPYNFYRFTQWRWLAVCLLADVLLGLLIYFSDCSLF